MMVTGGEAKQKKGEGKGFAGLSSLVSDVDMTPLPAAKMEPAANAPSHVPPAPQPAQPQTNQQHQTYKEPAQPPSSGSSIGKRVLGIAAVIGVLWFIGQSDKSPTSPTPAYSPPAQSATPSYSPPSTEPQVPSRQQESMPPVGQDLVFSTAQIRYCLAENIRMEGAKSALNNYIDSDVDRFNTMVVDYNSRCGKFRYRGGALEIARKDMEPYRNQLQLDGRSRFGQSPSSGSLFAPVPSGPAPDLSGQSIQQKLDFGVAGSVDNLPGSHIRLDPTHQLKDTSKSSQKSSSGSMSAPAQSSPAPDATVQAIQQKLNNLGYKAGPVDGLLGGVTRSAIIAFQQDNDVAETGIVDQSLLSQLQQASPRRTQENQRIKRPDLSRLSSSEKQSIESACSVDKYSNGPAAYNKCLNKQLEAMSGQGTKQPDLSRLSSSEKQSIESACSVDKYSNGPAAYNYCLSQQLARLKRQ
ncbi:MAG: peptidoglycan-binding protein [Magnetococcales bacterium]|nr:peptidoglycan-binding protein [Magnetococcales bacterium]